MPSLSKNLAPKTCGHRDEKPIRGLAMAAKMYPNSAIGFLFCNLSESIPENPWMMFRVARAIPSIIPTILPPAFRFCVRKMGNTG